MHVLWPIFHFKLNGVGYKTIRSGLGHFLAEVRSKSGQNQVKTGQIIKLIFLHKMGIDSMQLVTASLMVAIVLRYVVYIELLEIQLENLTSSILKFSFLL